MKDYTLHNSYPNHLVCLYSSYNNHELLASLAIVVSYIGLTFKHYRFNVQIKSSIS